jgi:uncharacterized membrane protein YphA (DoxX/SURF4 family)
MPQSIELSHWNNLANARALAVLRIGVGMFFLIFGQYKVFGTQFTLHGGFQFWINRFLDNGGAYPFMVAILCGFVLPHATPIAFLVAYGEFAIGLALTFGMLVRAASACGLIFMLTMLSRPTIQARLPPCGNTSAQASATPFSLSVLWFSCSAAAISYGRSELGAQGARSPRSPVSAPPASAPRYSVRRSQ